MNIREPRQFDAVRAERQAKHRLQKSKRILRRCIFGGVAVAFVITSLIFRPLPKISAKIITPVVPVGPVALSWPVTGQAAIGVNGRGVLSATPGQQPVPTASIAKVMLALAVLKKYPLAPGQQGPLVPITEADVALYDKYLGIDGSVVRVVAGEQITEYQALQAALLPSANNVADTLAIWAYGSMGAYLTAANGIAQNLGMTHSTFAGDASGFLPETVSTASDLVLLGEAALANPVIQTIVAQPTAELPVVGTVNNVNFLLGENGNIGIKTGNSDQAGGCFLFANTRALVDGQKVTSVGAVLGTTTLTQALLASKRLTDSFYVGFTQVVAVKKGVAVARYDVPWGGSVDAVAASELAVLNAPGAKTVVTVAPKDAVAGELAGEKAGTIVGKSAFSSQSVNIVLARPINSASWWWRLHRGLF